jgi:HipA-like protein
MLKLLNIGIEWLTGIKKPAKGHDVVFHLKLDKLPVGNLRLENDQWVFAYAPEFRAQTEIKPIVGFPAPEREYRSAELWPFFALRIPSLQQPVVQQFVQEQKEVDQVKLLEHFGQRSVANPFLLSMAHA